MSFSGFNVSLYGIEWGQTPKSFTTAFPNDSGCCRPNLVSLQLCLAPSWQNIRMFFILSTKGCFSPPEAKNPRVGSGHHYLFAMVQCKSYQETLVKKSAENVLRAEPGSYSILTSCTLQLIMRFKEYMLSCFLLSRHHAMAGCCWPWKVAPSPVRQVHVSAFISMNLPRIVDLNLNSAQIIHVCAERTI